MPMRARVRGVTALLVLAVVGTVAAACSGGSTTTAADARAPEPTSTSSTTRGHGDMGSMDMGGMDMSGAAHSEGAALPPLASRLAAATPAQRAATADVLARTRAAIAPYTSEATARAAGFVPADVTKRVVHYRNAANRRDDHELDPAHPEGLVYFRGPTGALGLIGALYTVRPGEPAPTPGGKIFFWHTHDPSCGSFLVPAGKCAGTFRMLHVWIGPGAPDPWIQPVREAFHRA
jgi:hypothetical protein